jgi:hypothetical protein
MAYVLPTVYSNLNVMTLYFSLEASDSPCVCCAELDIQLEVLNSFVALGNTLLWAYLLDDEGIRFDLPVEAFDGLPIAESIRTLTVEYQHVLKVLS